MTTIKIIFRPSTSGSGMGSLCYRINLGSKQHVYASGYSIYATEWNNESGLIISPADEERAKICDTIQMKLAWNVSRLGKALDQNDKLDVGQAVKDMRQSDPEASFMFCMHRVIGQLTKRGKHGTASNYQYSLSSFSRFLGHKDIAISDITAGVIESYQAWLQDEGLSLNSISFYMRNLRAVYKRLVEDGKTVDRKPFRKVYTGVDKTRKRAISHDDIKRLKELDLKDVKRLEFAREMFLMQFYCMGISFVDLAYLRKRNVRNNELVYRRQKTGQEIAIPINDKIQAIIDKYKDDKRDYLMPIITADTDRRRQYRNALHLVNEHLKVLGKMAGIAIPITTYTTRHSWATIAKSHGIPISVISDALGHDNVSTTSIYLSTIDTGTLARANASVLRGL